jgi:D-arabinose 1-dehydrogenase-like Zn-dependent alcohol dehydrogenase
VIFLRSRSRAFVFGQVGTYNHPGSKNTSGRADTFPLGGHTLGGYTDKFVVHENFAVLIPAGFSLAHAGPVMCAGVTLFDPLRRYGAGPGKTVAIVGIGGLGQMGVKIAKVYKA